VTRPGEWGPWLDGGAWLRVGGSAVDWLYRDVDRVAADWRAARDGRPAFHFQVGDPLGFLLAAPAAGRRSWQARSRRPPPWSGT